MLDLAKVLVVTLAMQTKVAPVEEATRPPMPPPVNHAVRGLVVDETGHGLAGVIVLTIRRGGKEVVARTQTDENGVFRLALPPGPYQIGALGPGLKLTRLQPGPNGLTITMGVSTREEAVKVVEKAPLGLPAAVRAQGAFEGTPITPWPAFVPSISAVGPSDAEVGAPKGQPLQIQQAYVCGADPLRSGPAGVCPLGNQPAYWPIVVPGKSPGTTRTVWVLMAPLAINWR